MCIRDSVEREKLYHPDEVLYVVDKRQDMHFTQVFRTARKAGIIRPETKLTFLGFGTMNGKDGKPFKTREGGVMRLEHLIRDVYKRQQPHCAYRSDPLIALHYPQHFQPAPGRSKRLQAPSPREEAQYQSTWSRIFR